MHHSDGILHEDTLSFIYSKDVWIEVIIVLDVEVGTENSFKLDTSHQQADNPWVDLKYCPTKNH